MQNLTTYIAILRACSARASLRRWEQDAAVALREMQRAPGDSGWMYRQMAMMFNDHAGRIAEGLGLACRVRRPLPPTLTRPA